MFEELNYKGERMEVSINGIEIIGTTSNGNSKVIGSVFEQKDKDYIVRWVAHDESKKNLTFATSRKKAVSRLIEKMNQMFTQSYRIHFKQEGLTTMRETIKREEALYILQSNQGTGIGFIKSSFYSEPRRKSMEYGWFDLKDEDINLVIKNDHVCLELWFNGLYGVDEPHLGKRSIAIEDNGVKRTIEQIKLKLKIAFEDIDYIVSNGTRYTIQH